MNSFCTPPSSTSSLPGPTSVWQLLVPSITARTTLLRGGHSAESGPLCAAFSFCQFLPYDSMSRLLSLGQNCSFQFPRYLHPQIIKGSPSFCLLSRSQSFYLLSLFNSFSTQKKNEPFPTETKKLTVLFKRALQP